MLARDGIGDFFAETNHEGPRNMSSQGVLVLVKLLGGCWWLSPTPLKNSQLGSFFPPEWKVIKFMFQTTNQKLSALESLEIMTHTGKY
jgi:hypothetical protein